MALKDRLKEYEKCLKKFEEVLNIPENEFIRDSAIKRFELCFELGWKTLKDYLNEEGIFCRSPKNCLKEAFSIGLIDDEDEWLLILEDRNLSVHTYNEELAEDIYKRLSKHFKAMKTLLKRIKENI
ncbi:MAG: nucleotidyltransferase [Persephonella sp.]|nr:MAG: nucleotidyltransferase [Persephonella sp.]